jgi:hypothetical protein
VLIISCKWKPYSEKLICWEHTLVTEPLILILWDHCIVSLVSQINFGNFSSCVAKMSLNWVLYNLQWLWTTHSNFLNINYFLLKDKPNNTHLIDIEIIMYECRDSSIYSMQRFYINLTSYMLPIWYVLCIKVTWNLFFPYSKGAKCYLCNSMVHDGFRWKKTL